jgi:IS5 family transposase
MKQAAGRARGHETVIAQSERRVLQGETVPARDKLVSLFETHANIIVLVP